MKLTEAVNNYYKNGDKTALYEAVVGSETNYNEKQEILKDTLKEEFDDYEFAGWIIYEKVKRGMVTNSYFFAD